MLWGVQGPTLPSIGTTDGSLIDGEMARFSATAASARRPRALRGGVEESLGRLVRPVRAEAPAKATAASRLRSEGRPDGAGFSRVDAVFESLAWPFEPRAMKSPGGGCPVVEEEMWAFAPGGGGASLLPAQRGLNKGPGSKKQVTQAGHSRVRAGRNQSLTGRADCKAGHR